MSAPAGDFQANLSFVDDAQYAGLTVARLLRLEPRSAGHGFVFVVDTTTLSQTDRPVLVVDCTDQPGRTFRVIPSQAWSVENNLTLGNMDFREFVDAADPHGVFRGFP